MQAGNNRHEHICESIELFAREVLPRFADGREQREAAKADRLAAAVDKALARRAGRAALPGALPDRRGRRDSPPRSGPGTCRSRDRWPARPGAPPLGESARRGRGQAAPTGSAGHASDARIERVLRRAARPSARCSR